MIPALVFIAFKYLVKLTMQINVLFDSPDNCICENHMTATRCSFVLALNLNRECEGKTSGFEPLVPDIM